MNFRGGQRFPSAISMPAEQCAIACAGLMVPHWRALSGLSFPDRALTSVATAGSKRFFMPASVRAAAVLQGEDSGAFGRMEGWFS